MVKRIVFSSLLLGPLSVNAITWSYILVENGKQGLRVKINEKSRHIELGSTKCSIDEMLINNSAETRSITCDVSETLKVTTTASCTEVEGVTKKQNTGDLTFFSGKDMRTLILHCE